MSRNQQKRHTSASLRAEVKGLFRKERPHFNISPPGSFVGVSGRYRRLPRNGPHGVELYSSNRRLKRKVSSPRLKRDQALRLKYGWPYNSPPPCVGTYSSAGWFKRRIQKTFCRNHTQPADAGGTAVDLYMRHRRNHSMLEQ